jgi:Domain of unknown function (DUF4249)
MRNSILIILIAATSLLLTSCEDVIQIDSVEADALLAVDGTITNQVGNQVLRLTKSQGYFDNSAPLPVQGAVVQVKDNLGNIYDFKDLKNDGNYVWTPKVATQAMGVIGRKYTLQIKVEGETTSQMNRVPKIDSLNYKFRKADIDQRGPKEGYDVQCFANDFKGLGDCYTVKAYKNGKQIGRLGDKIIFDGGFTKGSVADGLMFLEFSRRIYQELYLENDLVKIELYSITEDQFDYLFRIQNQINSVGLFAPPTSAVGTNIFNINKNSAKKAAGWFAASAVSTMETKIEKAKAKSD